MKLLNIYYLPMAKVTKQICNTIDSHDNEYKNHIFISKNKPP